MIKYQLKILNKASVWLACLICILFPFFFSLKYLNLGELTLYGEKYFIIIGMIILPDLMVTEIELSDVIYQTPSIHSKTFIIRLFIAVIIIGVLLMGLFLYAGMNHSELSIDLFIAILITSTFVGLLGLVMAQFTNQASGFLLTFSYYTLDLMTKGRYFSVFTLRSFESGGLESKMPLLVASLSIVCFLACYFYRLRK